MTVESLLREVYAALPEELATCALWHGGNDGFSTTMDHTVHGSDWSHRLVFDDGALTVSEAHDRAEVTFRVHGDEQAWWTLLSGGADAMDLLVHGDLVVDATTVDLVRHMRPFCLLFTIMAQLRD